MKNCLISLISLNMLIILDIFKAMGGSDPIAHPIHQLERPLFKETLSTTLLVFFECASFSNFSLTHGILCWQTVGPHVSTRGFMLAQSTASNMLVSYFILCASLYQHVPLLPRLEK